MTSLLMQEMEENKAVMLKLREHRAQEGWGRFVQSLLRFYKKCFNCIWLWGWVNQTDVHSPASHCCAFLSFCEHCVTKLSRIFLFIEKKKSFYFCPNRTKWSLKKQQEVWEVIGTVYHMWNIQHSFQNRMIARKVLMTMNIMKIIGSQ